MTVNLKLTIKANIVVFYSARAVVIVVAPMLIQCCVVQ